MSGLELVNQSSIYLAGKMAEMGINVPGLVVGAERVMNSITHKQQLDFDPDLIRSIVGILEGLEDAIWPTLLLGVIGSVVNSKIPPNNRKRSDGSSVHYGVHGALSGFVTGILLGSLEHRFLAGFRHVDEVSDVLIYLLRDFSVE